MENLVNISNLLTVRNYAAKNGVTPVAVYKWIESGKTKCVVVDGVKFILLTKEELGEMK